MEKIEEQEVKASELGFKLGIEQSDVDIFLVGNPHTNKVAVMGIAEIDSQEILVAYLVNVPKWSWAEAEGFTKDEMVKIFSKEVFSWIPIDEVAEYLV